MFLSKFLSFRAFYIFWGLIGAVLAFAWVRYLVEPKRASKAAGMTRLAALRALAVLSVGWYLVWISARGLRYILR
jgi:hypothetical protein